MATESETTSVAARYELDQENSRGPADNCCDYSEKIERPRKFEELQGANTERASADL